MKKLIPFLGNKQSRNILLIAGCIFLFSFTGMQQHTADVKKQFTDTLLFAMCDVMTGAEVASLSPFGLPLKKATSEVADFYTSCHYEFVSNDDYPQTKIVVVPFTKAEEAKAAYTSTADSWRDSYQREPERIDNLADSACFMGNADPQWCDDCGLQAWSGKYFITISFKGYYQNRDRPITARQKQDASVALLRLLFQKRPELSKKK